MHVIHLQALGADANGIGSVFRSLEIDRQFTRGTSDGDCCPVFAVVQHTNARYIVAEFHLAQGIAAAKLHVGVVVVAFLTHLNAEVSGLSFRLFPTGGGVDD